MFKFGLKLWSTNLNYMNEAKRLYEDGVYSYIELFVVPGSFAEVKNVFRKMGISFVIHAPHFRYGMNLAKKENEVQNRILMEEAQKFADELGTDKIIVHPGIAGDINETARQLKLINDERIIVENKPYYALDDGLICNGTTPEEIEFVMKEAGVGFCLDVGHAACAAKAHGYYYIDYLQKFLNLKPRIFHLADGDVNNLTDDHRHIGKGNFEIKAILGMIQGGSLITIETNKDSSENLEDFVEDVKALATLGGRG